METESCRHQHPISFIVRGRTMESDIVDSVQRKGQQNRLGKNMRAQTWFEHRRQSDTGMKQGDGGMVTGKRGGRQAGGAIRGQAIADRRKPGCKQGIFGRCSCWLWVKCELLRVCRHGFLLPQFVCCTGATCGQRKHETLQHGS